jgi:AcrR family transcriptional regulator
MGLRERKRELTRDALYDAAVHLIVERGYDATTMDDIAVRAMVSRATAFSYFPRKEDFLLEWAARRRAEAAAISSDAGAERGHPEQIRRVLVDLTASYGRKISGATGRAFVQAWLGSGGPLKPEGWASVALLTEMVRDGQQAGVLRRDVDAEVVARLLLNAHLGTLYEWAAKSRSDAWLRAQVEASVDVVLVGIAEAPGEHPGHLPQRVSAGVE